MAIRLVSVPSQDVAGVAPARGGVVSVLHVADLQVLAHALAQQRQHARDLDEREQIVVQLEGANLEGNIISDCHISVQLNHFISDFRSYIQ